MRCGGRSARRRNREGASSVVPDDDAAKRRLNVRLRVAAADEGRVCLSTNALLPSDSDHGRNPPTPQVVTATPPAGAKTQSFASRRQFAASLVMVTSWSCGSRGPAAVKGTNCDHEGDTLLA